jgi:hypothetical protein
MDGMCDSWMGMDGCRFVINNPLHVAVCRIALKECTLNSFVLQSVIYHSTYGEWLIMGGRILDLSGRASELTSTTTNEPTSGTSPLLPTRPDHQL